MKRLAYFLAFFSLGTGGVSYYRIKSGVMDASFLIYLLKLLGGMLAPVVAVLGLVGAGLGLLARAPLAALGGALGAWLSARYVAQVTAPHSGFEQAFGSGWHRQITPEKIARMRPHRWSWWIPKPPPARFEQDVAFWTLPEVSGGERQLLCDLWQPGLGLQPSGLGLIYMHAGGWQNFDKDTYTRPFFRYLASQGHVVMDVAYRLCHETDMLGMVGDVKRAIAWLKANAGRYGVDPARVVAGGASAGGHLALLAAYAPNHLQLDPADVQGADTSVCGAVAYYAPPDLRIFATQPGPPSSPVFVWLGRRLGFFAGGEHMEWPAAQRRLLGGLPGEVPQVATLMSPAAHVGPHCPPTLLLHGAHDRIVPVEDARVLYRALVEAGVSAVYLELPYIDHAFDLAGLHISPSAQAALYDVERFLALLAS